MYAIISDRGRQYRVKEGDQVTLDRACAGSDKKITFTDVLFFENGADIRIGRPKVEGVKVHAEVVQESQGPKVVSVKFRKRESFRRKFGQRAQFSVVRISKIEA